MDFSATWDVIMYVFGVIGISATIMAIVLGITRVIVKIVRWKRRTDGGYDRMVGRTSDLHDGIMRLGRETDSLWKAVDDINKRLKNAERQETKSDM